MNQKNEDEFNEMMEIAFDEQKNRLSVDDELRYGEVLRNRNKSIEDLSEPQCDEREVPQEMVAPYEMVQKPQHYQWFGKQAIDVIEATLSTEGYLGFLEGNALKYRLRAGNGKPGGSIDEDLMKAFYYEGLYNKFVEQNTP